MGTTTTTTITNNNNNNAYIILYRTLSRECVVYKLYTHSYINNNTAATDFDDFASGVGYGYADLRVHRKSAGRRRSRRGEIAVRGTNYITTCGVCTELYNDRVIRNQNRSDIAGAELS